jgi:hypothetical protein
MRPRPPSVGRLGLGHSATECLFLFLFGFSYTTYYWCYVIERKETKEEKRKKKKETSTFGVLLVRNCRSHFVHVNVVVGVNLYNINRTLQGTHTPTCTRNYHNVLVVMVLVYEKGIKGRNEE